MYRRINSGRLIFTLSLAILLSLTTIGCQQGPDLAEVSGRVTMDGDPMQGVAVEFQPDDGSPSYGTTDENGYYELKFTPDVKGALLGPHKIRITGGEIENEFGETIIVDANIPKKYNQDTTLEYTVVKGKNEDVDWELTSN